MIIDVANINTIPLDVKDKILNEFTALPQNIVSKIKNEQIEYKCDVLCAIEDYYGPFKAISFYNELIEILEKHEIICYHATKLYSKEDVLQYGLKTNDWDTYKYHLISTYQKIALSQSDIEKAISIVEQEYKRKYSERISQLCFFSNLSDLEGEYASYDQFCENIGGELARWALKKTYPQLYRPLKENGHSYIIKFKLPFSEIANYDKDTVAYQFVLYFAGLYFWNKKIPIEFDSNTQKNIPAENILEFISFDKDVDY